MAALPRLGVVVLNWNGRQHLADLLPGLLASDHPDYSVIVVDNASRDGSVDWLRREFPQVECVALDENRRFAGGNNAGAEHALRSGAEQLLILNNDTRIDPHCLRILAEGLQSDDGIGIVGPRICYDHEPCRIWYGGGILHRSLGWVSHRALRSSIDAGKDPAGSTDWVSGCALAVRGSVWSELGGLDESFYIYAEDVDFCLRARARGWSIHYEPEARLLHKVSASVGGDSSPFKSYHKARSGLQLFRRHVPGAMWPLTLLARSAHDLAMVGREISRGRFGSAGAVLQAWWDLPSGRNRYEVG